MELFFTNLDWTSVVTGVLSSLIASSLFILLLFRIRPHIKISPHIAKDVDPNSKETVYVFKVINKSPLFKIYELRCSVNIYEKLPSHNGEDLKRTDDQVVLINDNHWILERFNIRHISQYFDGSRKLKTRTDYAAQFGTKYDLNGLITARKIINVQVFAKHPLSGFSKVKFEDYTHNSQIIKGSFCSGNCFEIKP